MDKVRDELETLMNNVIDNCRGLFTENHRYQRTFEKGIYACAILKPSKRMCSNIGVDRELLLVASTFREQQQRTLKFLTHEIDNSQGRLENTIAIVVHLDKEGNLKLRNWGREAGISIVAINGNTKIESEEDFERRLSMHLYSHDPFDVSGPVSSDTSFFGRREEAIDLARKLQTGQIRSCLGIRKIGKTSIINRVLLEIRKTHDCVCVMIDCSRDEVFDSSAEVLLASLADSLEIAKSNDEQYSSLQACSRDMKLAEARNYLERQVSSAAKPVILVFDEIDYITPGSPTAEHWKKDFNRFWRSLRTIFQECTRNGSTLSILVGGVSTFWFVVEQIDGVENAALAFVPEEYLSPMPTGASIAMLRRLGRISGLSISEGAAHYISTATGNIPFWSRKCASYIHRHIDYDQRPVDVTQELVNPLVAKFIQEEGSAIAEVALTHLFRVHPDTEVAARAIYDERHDALSASLFRTVRRYGIASEAGEFSGAMIRAAYGSLATVVESMALKERGTRAEGTLGDWAEDLSVLNKRRNLLEKRLRGIVLNFIRAEAISNKTLPELRSDVLTLVSSRKRVILTNLSAEEMMERLDWLELVQMIGKKWKLFQELFGDKRRFMDDCEIVNERPDAHAKDFDQADFALYRRALSKIEDGLSKLG